MDAKIWDLVRTDGRFMPEAYEFVCDVVSYTQDKLGRGADTHVTGAELARGACALAVERFGMMAPTVFKFWGVASTDDLGEIVFRLIEADKLSRSDRDDRADFVNLFDLPRALADGYSASAADYSPRRAG